MTSPEVFWPYFAMCAAMIGAIAFVRGPDKIAALARATIAIPIATFSAEHFASAHSIMNGVPAWMPWHLFWTYFCGAGLLAASLSLISGVQLRLSTTLLGIMLFCFFAMIDVPAAIANPGNRFAWTLAGRESIFGAGAVLLGMSAGGRQRTQSEQRIGTVLFYWIAIVCVFYGVEHFLHSECVPAVPLIKKVPLWIPLAHFWTLLTGVLLVAGGCAMFGNRFARRASAGLGAWVLLLVLSLYVAIMIAQRDIEGVNYFTDTMMFAGILFSASLFPQRKRDC